MHRRHVQPEDCTFPLSDGTRVAFERLEARVTTASIRGEVEIKRACGLCPNFDKNFGCPPYSPLFDEWAAETTQARLICLRAKTSAFPEKSATERMVHGGKFLQQALYLELMAWRNKGYLVAGAGPCPGCERCALTRGARECANPDAKVCSLESLGVNVVTLAKGAFGIDLEWDREREHPETVVAIGGVFTGPGSP